MRLISLLLVASLGYAQAPPVNQVNGFPGNSGVYQYFRSGSNVTYICYAAAQQGTTTYVIGAGLTNVTVATNVGTINFAATAQLWVGQQITLAGFATSALNGAYKVTAVSGSTATITTAGVADATYNTAAALLFTTGPVLNANVWSINALTYDGSNNLIGSYYAGAGIAPNSQLACSNRANY